MSTEIDVEALVAAGDTEALTAALNQITGGDPDALEHSEDDDDLEQIDDKKTSEKSEEKTEENNQQTGEAAQTSEAPAASGATDELVVLTADGKHAIPHAVLAGTRNKLKEAERALAESQQKIAELQEKISGKTGAPVSVEELAELDPRLAKVFQQQQEMIEQLRQKTQQVVDPEAYAAERAFLETPELAELRDWQKNVPERFELAQQLDEALRQTPAYQAKTFAQRFAHVQQLVKIEFGDVVPSPKNALTRAQQIVAEQEKTVKPPTTLSATSATTPSAERSIQERLMDKSPAEIERELSSMTKQQREQVLAGFIIGT